MRKVNCEFHCKIEIYGSTTTHLMTLSLWTYVEQKCNET